MIIVKGFKQLHKLYALRWGGVYTWEGCDSYSSEKFFLPNPGFMNLLVSPMVQHVCGLFYNRDGFCLPNDMC